MRFKFLSLAAISTIAFAAPAWAAPGDPVALGDGVTLDPILDANLRYEHVDQAGVARDADAVTIRLRLGAELKAGGFSLLAEGEGTGAISDHYNDTLPGNGVEPYPIVADPENIELNRLQVAYAKGGYSLTLGRQRIVQDNARFVGNVGWRQNEQTFDAMRAQAALGPVKLDAAYAISQRTVFGTESPNEHFDGDLVLLNAAVGLKPVTLSAFAYLIDYDTRLAFSSQTYGLRAAGTVKLGGGVVLDLSASFATQSDFGGNPIPYTAEYHDLQVGLGLRGFSIKVAYEELGSDGGVASFQTPLATLHAFSGWADLFLTTPAAGLRDYSIGVSYKFAGVTVLPGLNAAVTWHSFESDFGGVDYGSEWDASVGFRLGKVGLLAKYASYRADGFGADTDKLWLQASVAL
ncbi:alginate export family protein [Altererythrobacter sp. CC-YST694]|uniref:alginate export family protein n=1 Tax=Altererythrobacter sp. CC-YST694 TaxID=2755038 RepID=UPI001D029BD2|nr:alginate export family protein [Altererythrobacter sp. CC-YST694]MCB5425139.1 alginate export family protein [Altererythrobacter sp. CC-YST694]